MSAAPTRTAIDVQAAAEACVAGSRPAQPLVLAERLVASLWKDAEAEACGLDRASFAQVLADLGADRNFGLGPGLVAREAEQAAYFAGLRLADAVLARACACGIEKAWERFLALYREPLLRAGIAITGSETLGRELADGLYAELFGLSERDGRRRCPLQSYSGRGSLLGWLRTTLAQRHVDHLRKLRWDAPLGDAEFADAQEVSKAAQERAYPGLRQAISEAIAGEGAQDRFVLASYFLDGRTLGEIARVLGIHEATVSRRLRRSAESVRKRLLHVLKTRGLSRRQAQEALETDPRDLSGTGWLQRALHGGENAEVSLQESPAAAFKEGTEL